MTDTKNPAALTGAERQARYAEKRRLSRDAERRTLYLARTAELLERYQAKLAEEQATPDSRFVKLLTKRVMELEAILRRP